MSLYPVLYSFRRCPYAIRARYILSLLGTKVEIREVVLKDKPTALLNLGGRSSVPQLVDVDGQRYPESLDIIFWALQRCDNAVLIESLWPVPNTKQKKILSWLNYNDRFFKYWLDRYKYADRHPQFSEAYYRQRGEVFLQRMNSRLQSRRFLMGEAPCLADVCLFPFVRQFAAVDAAWFESSPYGFVRHWLDYFLASERFSNVMEKRPKWQEGQMPEYFEGG